MNGNPSSSPRSSRVASISSSPRTSTTSPTRRPSTWSRTSSFIFSPPGSGHTRRRVPAVAATNAARTGSHLGETPRSRISGRSNSREHAARLCTLPPPKASVGAAEDELMEEIGLPATDRTLGRDPAGDGAVEHPEIGLDGLLAPHAGRRRRIVDRVGAGGMRDAPDAVPREQPHPHVGVAGRPESGLEPALLLEGRPVHHRRRHADEGGVAQHPCQRLPGYQVAFAAEALGATGRSVQADDVDAEQQHPLPGRRTPDGVEQDRAGAGPQEVVVMQLEDPVAGGQAGGAVHVPGKAERRAVPDVAVPTGPVGQQAADHGAAGLVSRPVGHGHLDLGGHRTGRLDDRGERTLEQLRSIACRHRDRQRRPYRGSTGGFEAQGDVPPSFPACSLMS